MSAAARVIDWVEAGRAPDRVVRYGIRRLIKQRLADIAEGDCERSAEALEHFVAAMADAPVAPLAERANDQHYELPPALFAAALGPHRKYSCCHWPPGVGTLAEAERLALEATCARAELADGQRILELGCGWGSLTLFMAARYPQARILAVTNSAPQRDHVTAAAAERGLRNVRVIVADMNSFAAPEPVDRIVSVEMFEHMRNYAVLFERVASWLVRDGRFFMHVFCHRDTPYEFVDTGPADWMSRYFFAGGMMPSDDLPLRFQKHLALERRWRWSGAHYQKTAESWLANFDAQPAVVGAALAAAYGATQVEQWRQRWRMFFMACAELFGYDSGQEWYVSHYLFKRADAR
jgi:cyclopropane-fatty-acyl-phospholipid synthase